MTSVFIGGSRRLTRLSADVLDQLDQIMTKGFSVLIGDANGADKAVQEYLSTRSYDKVEVFCAEHRCRNNMGNWRIREVAALRERRSFDYYATKDRQMADEASVGLMLWDTKSVGTLANIYRLVTGRKKVIVYMAPTKSFATLTDEAALELFLADCPTGLRDRLKKIIQSEEKRSSIVGQGRLM